MKPEEKEPVGEPEGGREDGDEELEGKKRRRERQEARKGGGGRSVLAGGADAGFEGGEVWADEGFEVVAQIGSVENLLEVRDDVGRGVARLEEQRSLGCLEQRAADFLEVPDRVAPA